MKNSINMSYVGVIILKGILLFILITLVGCSSRQIYFEDSPTIEADYVRKIILFEGNPTKSSQNDNNKTVPAYSNPLVTVILLKDLTDNPVDLLDQKIIESGMRIGEAKIKLEHYWLLYALSRKDYFKQSNVVTGYSIPSIIFDTVRPMISEKRSAGKELKDVTSVVCHLKWEFNGKKYEIIESIPIGMSQTIASLNSGKDIRVLGTAKATVTKCNEKALELIAETINF